MTPQTLTFEPIAYAETCYRERFGTPRQPGLAPDAWGVIRLRPDLNLTDALEGLEGFSHLWVVFLFHRNTNKAFKAKVHPPRLEGGKIGAFATRSPHRPNPIGLSAVKIEEIADNAIHVSGIDLVDGTPVLDLKPYVPSADRIEAARGGWTESRPERFLDVTFSDEALDRIESLGRGNGRRDLKALIRQTLELDPRPVFYKGVPGRENPYMDTYGFGLEGFNVVYRVDGRCATVLRLENWSEFAESRGQRT